MSFVSPCTRLLTMVMGWQREMETITFYSVSWTFTRMYLCILQLKLTTKNKIIALEWTLD